MSESTFLVTKVISFTLVALFIASFLSVGVFARDGETDAELRARLAQEYKDNPCGRNVDICPDQPSPIPPIPFFSSVGKVLIGDDVKALQNFLNRNGHPVAEAGPGSLQNETTFFGPATKEALISFQVSKGLVPTGVYNSETHNAAKEVLKEEDLTEKQREVLVNHILLKIEEIKFFLDVLR